MPVKHFGASPGVSSIDAKAQRLAGQSAGHQLQDIAHQLTEEFPEGQGVQLQIPVSLIDPDPNNPRHLRITWESLVSPPSAEQDRELAEDVEAIRALAASIRDIGQQEPIKVFERGGRYTVVTGGRRYWALRLAESETAEVKLLRERPARVALVQHAENVVRKNFRLYEELLSLERVIDESARTAKPVRSASDVRDLGYTGTTSKRWWRVLQGPQDVREAILERHVTSLETAARASQEPSAERRREILAPGDGAAPEARSDSAKTAVQPAARGRGRPVTVASFGKTKNLAFARDVLLRLAPHINPASVDWKNARSVTHCARTVFRDLEREFTRRGTK